MKNFILAIISILFIGQLIAQDVKPGVKTTFHAVDSEGKPLDDQFVDVIITFAKKDENGNKVTIYNEEFTKKTTRDGYFQWEVGAEFGEQPTSRFGEFKDVDFKDPDLCIRVSFRPEGFNQPWIDGEWSRINPVPVAANSLDGGDPEDADKDAENEIQEITKSGSSVTLSRDGGTVSLNDDDPTNELQVLSYDPQTKLLELEGGNTVDLSHVSPWMEQGSVLCTQSTVEAKQFRTKDGRTDIEGGKVSLRYPSGSDGIEMGVDEEGLPFITFMTEDSEILAEIRMGPNGFGLYKND